jgi:hypothetical protein
MMTEQEALETLKAFNAWRRDRNDINQFKQPDPKAIGKAIDVAIKLLEKKVKI